MDESALTGALEHALTQVPEASAKLEEYSPEMRERRINHELAEIVLPILEVQPEFKDKAPMIKTDAGSAGFQSQYVAPILVREARRRRSAKKAVMWLVKVLGTESAEGLVVQPLWGVSPTQRISILENVDLLPFESLPPSRQKGQFTNEDCPNHSLLTPSSLWPPPTAALIAEKEIRPFLIDASKEGNTTDNSSHQVHRQLDDIRLCLALEGPSNIVAGPWWFQYNDPDLEAALLFSGVSYSHQELATTQVPPDSPRPKTDPQAIVRAYMELESGLKKRIRIALGRLDLALIRSNPAARAIEISIALETLLMDSQGEFNFKLSFRAALLVSENLKERIENRKVIKAAYDMRSKLLHKGSTTHNKDEVADRAIEITALVIKRVIKEGELPDWNLFELSNGKIWKDSQGIDDDPFP